MLNIIFVRPCKFWLSYNSCEVKKFFEERILPSLIEPDWANTGTEKCHDPSWKLSDNKNLCFATIYIIFSNYKKDVVNVEKGFYDAQNDKVTIKAEFYFK